MKDLLKVAHVIGFILILASLTVGIAWAITKKSDLEPIAFVLATAGALLMVL